VSSKKIPAFFLILDNLKKKSFFKSLFPSQIDFFKLERALLIKKTYQKTDIINHPASAKN
jgi:hypothetical protein